MRALGTYRDVRRLLLQLKLQTERRAIFLTMVEWEPVTRRSTPLTHNLISVRHHPSGPNAGGNVAFADGHAQAHAVDRGN
jgi:prepilin-type processing-associated H-X9-DG protein